MIDDELYTSKDKSDYGRYTGRRPNRVDYGPDRAWDVAPTTTSVAASASCD